jgi:hypothetical protein
MPSKNDSREESPGFTASKSIGQPNDRPSRKPTGYIRTCRTTRLRERYSPAPCRDDATALGGGLLGAYFFQPEKRPSPLAGEGCVGLANEVSLAEAGRGYRAVRRALSGTMILEDLALHHPLPNLSPQGGKGFSERTTASSSTRACLWLLRRRSASSAPRACRDRARRNRSG